MTNDKDKISTTWSRNDEAISVHILTVEKILEEIKANWSANTLKKNVWIACEAVLVGSENKSRGVAKNITANKNRWQRVHPIFFEYMCLLM